MPLDFPPRTPNVPDTNPITLGSKRYLWTGKQWAASDIGKLAGAINGIVKCNGQGSFSVESEPNATTLRSSLSATKIGEVTVGPGSAFSSFGIQPAGTYEARYVSGYVDQGPGNGISVSLEFYPDPQAPVLMYRASIFESISGHVIRFYHGGNNQTIRACHLDTTYTDNSGPGVTVALYLIRMQ